MAEERVQRRLAAILAADVVGYSSLMEKDEAGTLLRLKSIRSEVFDPKVGAFGGHVFKNTGDGAMVEFGSSVDAVQCAVEIQHSLAARNAELPAAQQLVLRIGISQGDVIVDGEDLYGNGVNVAARMEGLAEPGGICISGNVQEHIGNTLDVALEDLGEQSVKNIDRQVRCYRVQIKPVEVTGTPTPPLSDKPSIAVLPFANMSEVPEQEYFSDGISEDIITALTRARWFRVISRNSSFTYRGTSLNLRQVADELGVRYVLEGSVRKAGNRVRITAQLIDGETDNHLWAERYDRELKDIFEVQDEITASIAGQIEPQLRKAEINRSKIARPESMDAWDMYQQGMWHMHLKDEPDFHTAYDLCKRAMEIDSNFAPAYGAFGHACYYLVHFLQVEDRDNYIEQGLKAARRGVELDDEDPSSAWALGSLLYARGDLEEAKAALDKSFQLNPLIVDARLTIGRILVDLGQFSEAVEAMQQTLQLCPNDPKIGIAMSRLAEAYFHLSEYDKAIEWTRRAYRQIMAPRMWGQVTLLASLGYTGDLDAAGTILKDVLARRPKFSLSFVREHYPLKISEAKEHLIEGLRKAGVPEN
jgi:adenylate cyclase